MSMIVRSNVLPLISSAAVIVLIILFLFSIYGCRPDPGAVSCCFYFSKISVTVQNPHTYGNLPRSFPSDAWQVTSKNPFQIGFADGIFAFKPVFYYGQRSKCADLLNDYELSTIIMQIRRTRNKKPAAKFQTDVLFCLTLSEPFPLYFFEFFCSEVL